MQKLLIASLIFIATTAITLAADIDPIPQTKVLLDQYSARVKTMEAENMILREEMRKAGIKIPLSVYSGAIATISSTTGSIA
jgi:hypothetical protein